MKLELDVPAGRNLITGYGDGYVVINQRQHRQNLILLPDRIVEGWAPGGFAALAEADMAALAGLGAELVLLGTGRRQRFPAPALLRPLIEARLGYEVMELGAACRTYNLLLAEGRQVAAALLLD